MSIEIKIGGPHLTIHHGHGVMVSDPDGSLVQPSQKGLFFRDTRLMSAWSITAQDRAWRLVNSANESFCLARVVLINPPLNTMKGELPENTIALTIGRLFDDGLHEDIDVHNYGQGGALFNLQIALASDFADFFEVKSGKTFERGGISSTWSEHEQTLTNVYKNGDFVRGLVVSIRRSDSRAAFANGQIILPVALDAGDRWHACLTYDFIDGPKRFTAPACPGRRTDTRPLPQPSAPTNRRTTIRSASADFDRIIQQAIDDMIALQLHVPDAGKLPIPAGGVPWFLSLFGGDSIIASLQFQIIDPEFARGTLDRLATLQATEIDDYRDAQPGKIPHELRHGELAFFGKIPHTPYYGTADATPLYLILLHSTWRCTGDYEIVRRHLSTAERCLDWIDQYGDLDGDGFQEYQTRSTDGYENQSWKDAGDAVLYSDGSCVKGPKALCELQGYVFDAWVRMSEIFEALGDTRRSEYLQRKADDLQKRFNEAFWDEEAGFYALALDGEKHRVTSVTSNPGHCLWSGIVPADRARRVVDRLMQPDMWSGWGIRTLSALHPAFNPYSYQNGSVWPHDNSLIALGMKRYGLLQEAEKIASAICDAASYFMAGRLPELYAGTERDEIIFPLRYPGSNVPQSWATGALFAIVQALIGFQPDAPHQRLELDPSLPDWLREIEIQGLRLAGHSVDLRFWRDGANTCFEGRSENDFKILRAHRREVY
jgi:glycogen debranching enzyme